MIVIKDLKLVTALNMLLIPLRTRMSKWNKKENKKEPLQIYL
jgi:hypothetical protein